ncbi:hypothetical protein P8452_54247 [Trifolium repens]|nr:hypothetical protein P8452_54247 [Trifolium repens]
MDTSEAAGRGFLPSSSVAAMDGNCGKLSTITVNHGGLGNRIFLQIVSHLEVAGTLIKLFQLGKFQNFLLFLLRLQLQLHLPPTASFFAFASLRAIVRTILKYNVME